MKADENTWSEIMDILNKYAEAYLHKDIESMMSLFANDSNLVIIGTGEDEWVEGFKELKTGFHRDFSQADNINITFHKINISNSGNVAWVSTKMAMICEIGVEGIKLSGRLSMVLEKRNNKWLITHMHFSLPALEQETGYSYPRWQI